MRIPNSSEIFYQLINYERHKGFLESLPHEKFLDLAVVFYRRRKEYGRHTVEYITYEQLSDWGITQRELQRIAENSMRLIFPCMFAPLREMLEKICQKKLFPRDSAEDEINMYALTNIEAYYGASAILYPGVLEGIGDYLDQNYYLLPSSVHECILIPEKDAVEVTVLRMFVREVNASEVPEKDILSDSVYFFDRKRKELVIC